MVGNGLKLQRKLHPSEVEITAVVDFLCFQYVSSIWLNLYSLRVTGGADVKGFSRSGFWPWP
jgi:hypothetical protein